MKSHRKFKSTSSDDSFTSVAILEYELNDILKIN